MVESISPATATQFDTAAGVRKGIPVVNRFRPSRLALALELFVGVNAMPGQTATFQTRFVTANGVKLHYVEWGGKGESLVYLTELGGMADGFDPIAKRVTGRFHVIGLTRRGQGESEKPSSGYDVDTLAQDITAFLNVLNIKRAILVGVFSCRQRGDRVCRAISKAGGEVGLPGCRL